MIIELALAVSLDCMRACENIKDRYIAQCQVEQKESRRSVCRYLCLAQSKECRTGCHARRPPVSESKP